MHNSNPAKEYFSRKRQSSFKSHFFTVLFFGWSFKKKSHRISSPLVHHSLLYICIDNREESSSSSHQPPKRAIFVQLHRIDQSIYSNILVHQPIRRGDRVLPESAILTWPPGSFRDQRRGYQQIIPKFQKSLNEFGWKRPLFLNQRWHQVGVEIDHNWYTLKISRYRTTSAEQRYQG